MIKKGMRFKSNKSGTIIVITGKKNGMGHWNTRKETGKKNHTIHEGTINKFYTEVR